jgi:ferrous iron transport protein B
VGLVTGVLAKEVVVGTLNTLYTQLANVTAVESAEETVLAGLKAALASVPKQLLGLVDSLANPVVASAGDASLDEGAMGVMYRYFDGPAGAMAYLLFVLLYFPCISAVAAMWRESSFRWAAFSALWTTTLAYVVATIFYQVATWTRHPISSCTWVLGLSLLMTVILMVIKSNAIIRFKKLPA